MQSQEKMTNTFRQNGQNGSAGNGHVDKVINKVINNDVDNSTAPSLARDRVPKFNNINIPGNVIIKSLINSCGNHNTGARAYTRIDGWARIKNKAAYLRALRIAKFGADVDPVKEVVKEAIKAFKPVNVEVTSRVWLKIANAIGYSNFLDCVWQQQALFEEWESSGKRIWDKAIIFHRLLNKRFPLPKSKGGAK